MKKLNKKQKIMILVSVIILIILIGVIIGTNIIRNQITSEEYNTANGSSSNGNLLPEYIKAGITLGGVTGTLVDLDTSDATATAADIALGKTAYVNGVKITGTYQKIQEPPTITSLTATETTIRIVATGGSSNITGYAYSTISTVPYYFHTVTGTMNFTYTLEGLASGTTYYVWVQDANGLVSDVKSIRTGEEVVNIPDLNSSNTTFIQNINYWTNQNVTVSVSTTVSGYTLQLATGAPNVESNWHNATSQIMESNGTVYARLSDGTHSGGWTSYEVTNIDKTLPNIMSITETVQSIIIYRDSRYPRATLNVTLEDNDSGIAKVTFSYKSEAQTGVTQGDERVYATINGTENGQASVSEQFVATFSDADYFDNAISIYVTFYDVAGNSISYLAWINEDGSQTSYTKQ